MDTTLIAFGDEIEELLKQSVSSYVSYTKHLPGTDFSGPFLCCLDGMCRDAQFPNAKCEICTKAVNGVLGRPVRTLVSARRARLVSHYSFASSGVRLARAADIAMVLDIVTQLHDLTNTVATGAPSLSSDTIEPIKTGTRNKRTVAA